VFFSQNKLTWYLLKRQQALEFCSCQDPLQGLFRSPLQTACVQQNSKGIRVGEKVGQNIVLTEKHLPAPLLIAFV
jgi:hypothetical protein